MPHRSINDITIMQWCLATVIALWAIVVSFIKRQFEEETSLKKKLYFLVQDFVISGGTTYLVFMIAIGYDLTDTIALPLAGFLGHKATRLSYLIEFAVEKHLGLNSKDITERIKEEKDV